MVIGRPVRFGKAQGVIGIKAVHLTTAAERRTMPKTKDLYIDIGATSKAAAEKLVSLGDYGVFDSAVVEFGDGLIKAKAIDDRVGCAALLKLLEDEPPIDTWFCFTVQEEVGLRGAASMAFALDPGFAMVLEGTTAADLAEVKGADAVCRVRGGVVLPFMDGATIYDAELFELLRDACIKRGIPWQTKTRVAGGTDAGRIHKSRAGVRVCAAAAPVRYIHSPSSVAAAADCEAVPCGGSRISRRTRRGRRMSKVFDLWNEVGSAFGPSGREDAVRETIAGIAGAYIDDVTTDALGNLICRKKGAKDGRKVLFAAHMDSIGVVATYIDENGFIRFSQIGGLYVRRPA